MRNKIVTVKQNVARPDEKVLTRYENRLIGKLQTLWKKQMKYLLREVKPLFEYEDDGVPRRNDIDPRLGVIIEELPEKDNIAKSIVASMKVSLTRGGKTSVKNLKLGQFGISYKVDNVEAKKFLNRKLSHELSNYQGNIHKTTQDHIRKTIQQAIDEGKSYAEVSQIIQKQGKEGVFSLARGELIAITETGRAYGKGARIPIDEFRLTNPTRTVLKSWVTAGDKNVRPTHTQNSEDGENGWIDYDKPHSGTDEQFAPSKDYRCRCAEKFKIPPPE